MKKFKFNQQLLAIYLAIAAALLLLGAFVPKALLVITHSSWLFLLILVTILISPLGSITLGREEILPAYSLSRWFSKVLLLQILMALTFFGLAQPLIQYFLATRIESATHLTLSYMSNHWGLFPFAMYGLLAIAIGSASQTKVVTNLRHLLTFSNTLTGQAVDLFFRQSLFWVCGFSIGIVIIILTKNLTTLLHLSFLTGTTFNVLVIITLLLLLPGTRTWTKITRYLWTHHAPMGISLVILSLLTIFVLFILNIIIVLLTAHHQYPLPFSDSLYNLLDKNANAIWLLTVWVWWLGWTPIVAAYLAAISRGRSLRVMILGCLALPVAISLVAIFHWDQVLISGFDSLSPHPALKLANAFFWPILSMLCLVIFLNYSKLYEQTILSSISDLAISEHNRLPITLFRGLLQMTLLVVVLGICGGIWALYLIGFALVAQLFVVFMGMSGRFILTKIQQ